MMPALEPGQELRLLHGGAQLFDAMTTAIALARREVLLETYIFDFTATGGDVAAALVQAARRGVAVRLLVDGAGTPSLPADWRQRFDAAGVQWHVFSPLGRLGLLIPSRWRRLHRKLCVVDQHTAFCGGINILDDYHDPQYGTLKAPRFDFAVQLRGSLVAQVHDAMTQLWWRVQLMQQVRERDWLAAWEAARAGGPVPTFEPGGATSARVPERRAPAKAALVLRDNLRHRRTIERAYLKAIGAAHDEIIIANAYFLPGGRLRRALMHAARRGVRVRVLLQGRYEYFMQYHAARPVFGALLEAGVELHEYEPSFLHAKVAVIDAHTRSPWVTVGSSNLDPLSLLLAREANVVAVQRRIALELRGHLQDAMQARGRQLDAQVFAQRHLGQRALDWLAYGLMRLALVLTGKRY